MFSECARKLGGLAGAVLGWRPDEFWHATPAELAAVLEAIGGGEGGGATCADLARLMEIYPDG